MSDHRTTWRRDIDGKVRLRHAEKQHAAEMSLVRVVEELERPARGELRGADEDLARSIIAQAREEPDAVHGGGSMDEM